jgi:hypothetical protein
VWIFRHSLKLITKFQTYLFVPITQRMHSLQSVRAMIQMRRTLQSDVPNTRTCLRADRLGVRPTLAYTRAMFADVRSEDSPTMWPFLHAAEPSVRHCSIHRRFHLEMWLPLIQLTANSALNLCRRPCQIKQFHKKKTHTLPSAS